MPEKFKVGDIVQLKSGGPKMTVTEANFENVWCSWFSGSKHDKAVFTNEAIKRAEDDKKKD